MKLLLDTCVIYPTVMREMLLGVAETGAFEPLWSDRILGEWQHTAAKRGAVEAVQAEGEIATAKMRFPKAIVPVPDNAMARFWLPDTGDIHVLAAAVLGKAEGIVTMNNKDFPKQILAEDGLQRLGPDELLYGAWLSNGSAVEAVAQRVLEKARALDTTDGAAWEMRPLLKKARLPRLAKAVG